MDTCWQMLSRDARVYKNPVEISLVKDDRLTWSFTGSVTVTLQLESPPKRY